MKSIAFCFLLTVPVALAEAFTLAPNSVGSRRTMSSPRSTTTTSLSICKAQATNDDNAAFDRLRGGDSSSTPFYSEVVNQQELSSSQKAVAALTSFWGTGGMVYILAKAIKRVVPIALEPFAKESSLVLTPFQWSVYALTCLFFAYYEGYKGFQTKFSPLVVKRSLSLVPGTPPFGPINILFAPLFSMGLINATRKRTIVSWCVTLGVATVVAAVKRLPSPWRTIVDAGVVVGLSWGALSILLLYAKSFATGTAPACDACLRQKPKSE